MMIGTRFMLRMFFSLMNKVDADYLLQSQVKILDSILYKGHSGRSQLSNLERP